ncbi:hypothetical protein OIU85_001495 [Salix viminalis]|uniref:Uncharacterized protein n=1 Tax=Salix viminalis TaxID=40686 RepID=A0A9Q0VNX5_SALVM|nr:hypothetical protein OIU85_001495 [Salix viminalis]
MGNAVSPCFQQGSRSSSVKLIFWEGTTRILTGRTKHIAGEIMFENPDMMICHADSFFIGHPVPSLAIDDELPSAPALNEPLLNFGESPFQYIKGADGRVLIKVAPEFIARLVNKGGDQDQTASTGPTDSFLCSTPELKKHYEQLVGSKEQTWSPKLDTISEYKIRYSPCRFIGLEWKQKEKA